jgi:hypothetical protein
MNNKKIFNSPYLGIDTRTFSHVFTQNGDYSIIIRMINPVIEYAADYEEYFGYHQLMDNIIKILGPGHTLQKLDVFHAHKYHHPSSDNFLRDCYFSHFNRRPYARQASYLILTKNEKRQRLFSSDPKAFESFISRTKKIISILEAAKTSPLVLDEAGIQSLIRQMLCLHFEDTPTSYHNLICKSSHIEQGSSAIKSTSLIDIDQINLPATIQPCTHLQEPGFPLPVDMMHFLSDITGYQSMIYHQAIIIPRQENILSKLRMKKKAPHLHSRSCQPTKCKRHRCCIGCSGSIKPAACSCTFQYPDESNT